jgi:small subunit ribosomal protein S16
LILPLGGGGGEKEIGLPVRIRLKRLGTSKKPFYRIVVMDVRRPRDGRSIEELGYYDPRSEALKIDDERARHWLGVGAQPTGTVMTLLRRAGVVASAAGHKETPAAKPRAKKAKPAEPDIEPAEPAADESAEEAG